MDLAIGGSDSNSIYVVFPSFILTELFDRIFVQLYPRAPPSIRIEGNFMRSTLRVTGMILFLFGAASIAAAADPNFAGTWKLNLAKSQLSGTVYTFEKTPSGLMHYTGGGFDADFDFSGKEHTMPSGIALAGKELSPTSWEFTFSMKGKTLSKSKVTLDKDSLAWVSDSAGADGKTVRQMSRDTRVSGGPGLVGTWKSGDLKGAATTLKITMSGANDITVEFPESQSAAKGSFDGKDYPVIQGGQATTFTNSFSRRGAALEITTKLSGKPFGTDLYKVSTDGKTLTDDYTATATNEKTKGVFDRQ
jgi:hypothetical protein